VIRLNSNALDRPGEMAEAMAYAQHIKKLVKEKYGVEINRKRANRWEPFPTPSL
jgi:hypothetical protein